MPFVQVTIVAGRTAVQKHALIAKVSAAVADALDTPIDRVRVAVTDVCAHRSTALSGGLVRDGILTCPGHFWRYDLRTGQCLNRPDRIPSHPCRVTDGWVDVLVPDPAPVLGLRAMLLAAARRG